MTTQPEALRLADALESLAKCQLELGGDGKEDKAAAAMLRRLHAVNADLLGALKDMHSGWKYIRETHGDLYGVGWDRSQEKAEAAIAKAEEAKP